MAAPVLIHSDLEPSDLFSRFAAIYSGPLEELPLSGKSVTVSTSAGRACARGALMALGIEMAAVLLAICVYGASHL